LHHRRLQFGALAHIVLPNSNRQKASPGKFADAAIRYMLDSFQQRGIKSIGLTAKLIGGACMFGIEGPLQIGESNVRTITQILEAASVRIVGSDVGGTSGRRITFDCSTGRINIETIGQPQRTL
ncbi:hypothetical protein LCGC14_1724620, partial [marine sediment metagenome]